jgi:TRAP-type uncharacterized transport system substrate-binding protein
LTQLPGWRVNVGSSGSGVPALMGQLFQSNHLEPEAMQLTQLDEVPATQALLEGNADAIVFASAPESLLVQMLLITPGIKLMNFSQNEAYSRRFAFLSAVQLPRGVVDLATDNPPQDVRLVAPTSSLITRADTHPALVQLFAEASQHMHGGASWFNKAKEFPNAKNDELPLSKEAERLMKNGAPLYAFRIRSRVFRWYAQLRDIEHQAERMADAKPLLAELNKLESVVEKIAVPLSYANELYALKNNIHSVRKKLQRT